MTQAAGGDPRALDHLLARHRDRLRRMVALRIDRRLERRVDPSDIVQEALAEAAQQLAVYARNRQLSFYPWLRRIAWQRLVKAHRRHIRAQRRSVDREEHEHPGLPKKTLAELSDCFTSSDASPIRKMVQDEMRKRVETALTQLEAYDREILVLRYLEQLSMREIGEVLGISEVAARQRHARALRRLQAVLAAGPTDLSEE